MGRPRPPRRSVPRLIAAHSSVEKITDGFVLFETFDDEFRTGRAGRRLNLHIGQNEPALNKAGAKVYVLNARVSQIHFAAKQDPDFHVDAFVIEAVAQRVITKIKIRQRERDGGAGEQRANDVVSP